MHFHRPLCRCLAALAAVSAVGAIAPSAFAASDDIAQSSAELTRTYRGEDGSALYTRAVGGKVVGFGEDAAGEQAFVFEGTRSQMTINGRWWDVAKGARSAVGELKLTSAGGGSTLKRSGGDDVGPELWQAKPAAEMIWPQRREAAFQSTAADNFDGAFDGSDSSRAYMRQSSDALVWVAERFTSSASGVRPSYTTVMIGKRTADGFVSGHFYDVPKGTDTLRHGSILGNSSSSPRTVSQSLHDFGSNTIPNRAKSYEADYAIDLDVFAQQIEQRLSPFVVGFGYAIAADNQIVRAGAGGARRIPQSDPSNGLTQPWPFTAGTVLEIASASKMVTLATVARVLHERGLTLDARIDPYLPEGWARGPGMDTVTFRQMLSHGTAPGIANGLSRPGNCATDFYGCLQDAVAGGMTVPAGYNNIHYTLMRVVVPFITDGADMKDLFESTATEAEINDAFSLVFRDAIRKSLALAQVNADFAYPAAGPNAFRYRWGTPPFGEIAPTGSEGDYLEAGSGGLKLSGPQGAQFLTRLEAGKIVPHHVVDEIKATGFGDAIGGYLEGGRFIGNAVGPLVAKGGGVTGVGSMGMIFPGGVQAYLVRNSTGNTAQANDAVMLRAAWQAALK